VLFEKDADYLAFVRVIDETLRTRPMRICAYCLMPNHWHLILWPKNDGDLPAFMQQLTNTHVKRWKEHRREIGHGHLYQGRYKCFPVQADDHFYDAVRYVERNALRANLVRLAEQWPWSSLTLSSRPIRGFSILADWPVPRPANWIEIVNRPQSEAELEALRKCANRGCPLGDPNWTTATARSLGIESTLRSRGRPKLQI
jgi:putative transposase